MSATVIKALVKARSQIGAAKKGSFNPHLRVNYADLADVMEAVREPLAANGLEFVQTIRDGAVLTIVLHESGEMMELAPFPLVTTKADAQGWGSALSYARRYSLQTALGVPSADDDGTGAGNKKEQEEPAALADARAVADEGQDAFREYWKSLDAKTRAALSLYMDDLKARATKAIA
jgi:hypothetical protein